MTPQQRIDWINYVDEISHRLHELMAIEKLEEEREWQDWFFPPYLDLQDMDDALQATKDLLPK